jgi:hypothetical protein
MPTTKVVLASAFGTVIEWYDFFIYGTAAVRPACSRWPADCHNRISSPGAGVSHFLRAQSLSLSA